LVVWLELHSKIWGSCNAGRLFGSCGVVVGGGETVRFVASSPQLFIASGWCRNVQEKGWPTEVKKENSTLSTLHNKSAQQESNTGESVTSSPIRAHDSDDGLGANGAVLLRLLHLLRARRAQNVVATPQQHLATQTPTIDHV
jgi:hypothetical protein